METPGYVVSPLNTHSVYSTIPLPGFLSSLHTKIILAQSDEEEQSHSKDAFGIQHVSKSATKEERVETRRGRGVIKRGQLVVGWKREECEVKEDTQIRK